MATKTRQLADFLIAGGQSDLDLPGKPHIQPGTLYPAIAGKDVDGVAISTSHGSTYTYGTTHADGRMYYYTDIKGSKPIKDPRIGAHFGSQRHKTRSLQLLEQETATHGEKVYSVDGREWMRAVGSNVSIRNTSYGNRVSNNSSGSFIEITGYFNDINVSHETESGKRWEFSLDGGALSTGNYGDVTSATPLGSRYVDTGSLFNIPISTTLGIHTVKIVQENSETALFSVELIAQDTSNRNNIQIPSQNVVSYGKKFTVSGTPHYDPFNGFTNGSSVTAYVDTATSLGVEGWKNSSTYYRPYNGGRVVKWVDSSGTIKTSVNMMPPNARSIGNSASLTNATAKANASIANNTFYPTMEAGTIDHSQAEVAKTFHWREFGNGAANGGTGATYADCSMLHTTADDISYVMDDGLTSFTGDDVHTNGPLVCYGNGDSWYTTFIGTGITLKCISWGAGTHQIAQNLPYGTHILKVYRGSDAHPVLTIDGVDVQGSSNIGTYGNIEEITFHQPKMPPIPEDAVVIADYMLMADFVAFTPSQSDPSKISKGVRYVNASRDLYYNMNGGSRHVYTGQPLYIDQLRSGISVWWGSITSDSSISLPYFGFTKGEVSSHWSSDSPAYTIRSTNSSGTLETTNVTLTSNGTISSQPTLDSTQTGAHTHYAHFSKSDGVLGLNTVETKLVYSSGNHFINGFNGFSVATPIHTSSHYQTFETPFLHELVGGDRNMEQTNLVVTADGKTWDEVTRDTSYMGPECVFSTTDTATTWSTDVKFDEWRGIFTYATAANSRLNGMNKDFAIAYDRLICLRDGTYKWSVLSRVNGGADTMLYINGTERQVGMETTGATVQTFFPSIDVNLKRGDYLQVKGEFADQSSDFYYNNIQITRLDK